VDVGANVGHHALFAATRCHRVIAIEPFPPLVARLRQKIDDNHLTNVTVVACGLGDRGGQLQYTPPASHNTGTGSFAHPASAGSIPLPIRRGDDVLVDVEARPNFIKIDTEGFERLVLRGLARTLADARPLVFFEWSPGDLADGDHARDLFPERYLFYRRQPDAAMLGVFRRSVLALEPLAGAWPESDILAVPVEFLDRARRSPSGARAARRLARG
jgi:FkbM family methyltransferase